MPEAAKDYERLDGSSKTKADKLLKRILLNPLASTEGGYGKPLSNNANSNIAGCLKIKLKNSGLRIVYKIEKSDKGVLIIVIGVRDGLRVYKEAQRRINKHKR